MEVILLKDIEKLGDRHDIVTVKGGYGRNFLIPQKMALVANKTNRDKLDQILAQEAAELERRLDEFKAIGEKLQSIVFKVGAKVGTEKKIFGSVTNIQLAQAIMEQAQIEVDRKKINILDEVKTLGEYSAKVDLHPKLDTVVRFEVVED